MNKIGRIKPFHAMEGDVNNLPPPKSFIMRVVDNKIEWQINGISYFEVLGWLEVMKNEVIKKIQNENNSKD